MPDSFYRLRLEKFVGPQPIEAQLTKRPPSTPQVDRVFLHEAERLPADFGDPLELSLVIHAHMAPVPQLSACLRLRQIELDIGALADAFTRLAHAAHLRDVRIAGGHVALPAELGLLDQITSLRIECPQLGQLPETLGGLSSLTELDVREHAITALPETLGRLQQLATLSIRLGPLAALPASIVDCAALSEVRLDHAFAQAQLANLAVLAKLPALRVLALIRMHAPDLDAFAGTALEELDLRYTKLAALPASIGTLVHLRKLNLESTGLDELPAALRDCTALRWISMPSYALANAPGIKQQLPKGRWKKQFRSGTTWYERTD